MRWDIWIVDLDMRAFYISSKGVEYSEFLTAQEAWKALQSEAREALQGEDSHTVRNAVLVAIPSGCLLVNNPLLSDGVLNPMGTSPSPKPTERPTPKQNRAQPHEDPFGRMATFGKQAQSEQTTALQKRQVEQMMARARGEGNAPPPPARRDDSSALNDLINKSLARR